MSKKNDPVSLPTAGTTRQTIDIATTTFGSAGGGLGKLDPKELEAYVAGTGGYAAAQTVSLDEPGDAIRGIYDGVGAPIDTVNDVTGEVQVLATHRFIVGKCTYALVGRYMLDAELPWLIGREITVARAGTKKSRSGNVNKYAIIDHSVDAEAHAKRATQLRAKMAADLRKMTDTWERADAIAAALKESK